MNIGRVILLVLAWCGPAWAQNSDEEDARRMYEAGQEAFATGHYGEAYAQFEHAYLRLQRPALLFNMASALQRLDRPHDAAEKLRAYLRVTPTAEDRVEIEERIRALEEKQTILDAKKPTPAPEAVPVLAKPPPPPQRYHLGIQILTDLPIQVGAKIWLELPYRLRLSTSFGYLPGGYVDIINDILVAAHAYSQSEADLIRSALQSSFIWRLHVGWRPLKNRGFYFEVGYGLASLGGGASSAELIAGVTGKPIPPDLGTNKGYLVSAVLHMVDVEVGWQWFVWKGLSLRAAVGFAGTVGAQTTVKPNFQPRIPAAQTGFTSYAASYLDQVYTSYVFAPVVSVAAGWRFF